MPDLTDLDRRAAVVMGLEEPFFTPTTEAFDCREFERFALNRGVVRVIANVRSATATVSVRVLHLPGYYHRHTSLAEHGPTFDLVAVVLALLAALEAKRER